MILQVLEETGYNIGGQLDPQNVIEMTVREQRITLFIVSGVPEDFAFKTKTRKEISVSSCSHVRWATTLVALPENRVVQIIRSTNLEKE
jgi:hypothetical protein